MEHTRQPSLKVTQGRGGKEEDCGDYISIPMTFYGWCGEVSRQARHGYPLQEPDAIEGGCVLLEMAAT